MNTGSGGACQDGTMLADAAHLTTSADDKSVYVVAPLNSAMVILDRAPATGELTQKPGTAGCVTETGSGGACQDATALAGARHLSGSADGANLYVASGTSDGIAIFDRDTLTGTLIQKPGTAGCVTESGSGGARQDGTGLDDGNDVTVSSDGKSVYAVSSGSDAVAVFDRATPAPPGGGSPAPSPPAPSPVLDTVAPVVSGFSLTRKRFRVGRRPTPIAARAGGRRGPRGSAFRFTLSELADVRILIERALPGRRVDGRCRAPSPELRDRPRCTRHRRRGTLTRRDRRAGRNTVRFSGRIGRRALRPGRYRATITSTDPAGNRSDASRARFRIVRR